jgi:uncharacterized membrane protein
MGLPKVQFQKNVGGIDRLVRGVVGTALVVAAILAALQGATLLGASAGVLGAGLLCNAATQFCGVNALLGVDTCSIESR